MRKTIRVLLVSSGIAFAVLFVGAGPALAACHHFTVTASPTSVAEGQSVKVTVSRDGAVSPSHVDLSTVDGTAKAGQDYTALARTVSFTTDLQQSFTVSILDDKLTNEPAQSFKLHLSNPGGCAVNPNFVLDPDVTVSLADNDPATTTTAATSVTTAPSTTQRVATTRPATTLAATTTSQASSSTSTAPATTALAAPVTVKTGGGGGGSGGLIAGIAVAVAALGGGGYLLYRRRAA
jgi:hypothetical protein